jgi:hypothetical protein
MKKAFFCGIFALVFTSFLFAQQDEEKQIKELIEKLGVDNVDLREKATDELMGLGEKARKLVESAKSHKDAEVRWRAELILKVIPVRERLGDKIWEKIPDVVKDIAYRDDWGGRLEIFTEFWKDEKQKKKISDEEVTLLVEELTRGVTKPKDKISLIRFIKNNKIKPAGRILVKYLEDKDVYIDKEQHPANLIGVGWEAARALGQLGAKECAKDIAKLLDDKDRDARWNGAQALRLLGAKEMLPTLKERLGREKDTWVQHAMQQAIKEIESAEEKKEK